MRHVYSSVTFLDLCGSEYLAVNVCIVATICTHVLQLVTIYFIQETLIALIDVLCVVYRCSRRMILLLLHFPRDLLQFFHWQGSWTLYGIHVFDVQADIVVQKWERREIIASVLTNPVGSWC
jgi:hypothetical protein